MPSVSIIARLQDPERTRKVLQRENAKADRSDRRTETWFTTARGRLVLRESDTRNELAAISSDGEEHPVRHKPDNPRALKEVLMAAMGVPTIVEMRRETFHLPEVLVHIDDIQGIGMCAQIEAIDTDGATSEKALRERCMHTAKLLSIPHEDIVESWYVNLFE